MPVETTSHRKCFWASTPRARFDCFFLQVVIMMKETRISSSDSELTHWVTGSTTAGIVSPSSIFQWFKFTSLPRQLWTYISIYLQVTVFIKKVVFEVESWIRRWNEGSWPWWSRGNTFLSLRTNLIAKAIILLISWIIRVITRITGNEGSFKYYHRLWEPESSFILNHIFLKDI